MHRNLLPLLTLSVLGSLAFGCSSTSSGPASDVGEATSSLSRNTSPNVAPADLATLAQDNTTFAINAYKVLGSNASGKNVFFSPYSISSALAMTYAGAGGQTATEMATAMHFSLDQSKLHPAFDSIDLALASRAQVTPEMTEDGTKPITLHVANAVFGEKVDSFGQPFLDTLMTSYGAGVELVDFETSPDSCRDTINSWISDKTNAKIQNVLAPGSIDGSTRLVLVDAIYFDGSWATPFQASGTQQGAFTKLDGSTVTASLMHSDDLYTSFASTDTYDAIEVPYAGEEVAMDIVIPKDGTFAAFESGLTGDSLTSAIAAMKQGPVILTLPKFTIAGDAVSVRSMLQGFGMNTAFENGADFSAIDHTTPVHISDVLHKAYVSVDEVGTEAAASTAVIMNGGAAPAQPTSIAATRPFFFALRDIPTGTIIFAGRVTDPTAQ